MRSYLVVAIAVLGLAGSVLAQRPGQTPAPTPAQPPPAAAVACPAISIAGPVRNTKPGETIRYAARVDAKDGPVSVQFRWTINPATIFAGQGGPEIEFERPVMDSVSVSLEVIGLPAHCQRNASETSTFDPAPAASRLDQFSGPLAKIPDPRLKRMVDILRNRPESQLYVALEYMTDETEPAAKQKAQLIASLLRKAGVEDKRVAYVIGKTQRERVQFWFVPAGAEYPRIEK